MLYLVESCLSDERIVPYIPAKPRLASAGIREAIFADASEFRLGHIRATE